MPLSLRSLLASTSALGALWLLPAAPAPAPTPPEILMPPPTENWLDRDAEKKNKTRRKEWFKEMHRAAPGIDWKKLERENGLQQITKRNLLAIAPPATDAFGGGWVERGSQNQAGRMHVARHSTDETQIYAGSSLGGVWKGSPTGDGWTPIGDNLYGGAHWLEILPPDVEGGPDVVLAATDSGLIHRTSDEGATWTVPTGLFGDPWEIRRLIQTSDGSNTIFMVMKNGPSRCFLYRSTDRAQSFELLYELDSFNGDLWTPRDGDPTLYLTTDDGLLKSADLGDSWTEAGDLPDSASEADLVGSEAGAPRLWLVLDNADLYRSDDAGGSWTPILRVDDYWSALNASIVDPDVFAWGGVEMHVTTDAGGSFEIVNSWSAYYASPSNTLHADLMGMDVLPDKEGGELWYIPTDGGLYRSVDTLDTVENLSLTGLRVSQYYDVLTSAADPTHIAAGAQDQGYQVTNGVTQTASELLFDQVISGDYGHLTSSDGSHEYVYSVYPGFVLIQIGEDPVNLTYADFPGGEYYAWLPPIVADPEDPEAFFFCGQALWRYARNSRGAWVPEPWSEEVAGSAYEYLSALAFSPLNPDRAYAATNYGGLYWSDDKGVTWSRSESSGPSPQYFYGNAIVASSLSEDEVLVGGSGYGATAVYRSTDGGRTFAPFDEGLPDTLVYSLGEAPDESGTYFAGTETAAYRRDAGAKEWTDITGADAPVTIYWSVEALPHEDTMRFGTYGRGIWDYQLDPEGTPCFPVLDEDGDAVDCLSDCDDGDPTVFPGSPEECDGIDRSCDPDDLAEGDADLDGYITCEDCDDADPESFPGAAEVCGDKVDQDCDGADLECEEEPKDTEEPEPHDTEAPQTDSDPPDVGDPEEPTTKGCGCASAPPSASGLSLLLLMGLGWRRRRPTPKTVRIP